MNKRDLIAICVVLIFACIILYVTWRRIKYQLNHSPNFPGSADMKAFTSDDWISLYNTIFDSNGQQIKLTSEHVVATDNENKSDDSRNKIGGVGDTDKVAAAAAAAAAAAEEDKEKEEKTFVIIVIETGNCNNVQKSSTKNGSDIITEDEEETETETNSAAIDTQIEIDTVFGTTSSSNSDSYNIRNSTHHRKEEGKVNAAVDKEDSNQQQTIDDDDAVGADNDDDFDESYNNNNTTRILPLVSSSIFPILSSCKGTKCVICLESFQIGDDVVWSSEEEEQQKQKQQQRQQQQQQQQQQHNIDTSNNNTYQSYNININNNYYCNHLFHKECMVHFLASNGKRRIMSNKPMVMIYNNNSSTDSDSINPCPTCRRNFCSITPNDCIVAAIAQ